MDREGKKEENHNKKKNVQMKKEKKAKYIPLRITTLAFMLKYDTLKIRVWCAEI